MWKTKFHTHIKQQTKLYSAYLYLFILRCQTARHIFLYISPYLINVSIFFDSLGRYDNYLWLQKLNSDIPDKSPYLGDQTIARHHKRRKNANKLPYPEVLSNPRSQGLTIKSTFFVGIHKYYSTGTAKSAQCTKQVGRIQDSQVTKQVEPTISYERQDVSLGSQTLRCFGHVKRSPCKQKAGHISTIQFMNTLTASL